jgi:hypothetical protein
MKNRQWLNFAVRAESGQAQQELVCNLNTYGASIIVDPIVKYPGCR